MVVSSTFRKGDHAMSTDPTSIPSLQVHFSQMKGKKSEWVKEAQKEIGENFFVGDHRETRDTKEEIDGVRKTEGLSCGEVKTARVRARTHTHTHTHTHQIPLYCGRGEHLNILGGTEVFQRQGVLIRMYFVADLSGGASLSDLLSIKPRKVSQGSDLSYLQRSGKFQECH